MVLHFQCSMCTTTRHGFKRAMSMWTPTMPQPSISWTEAIGTKPAPSPLILANPPKVRSLPQAHQSTSIRSFMIACSPLRRGLRFQIGVVAGELDHRHGNQQIREYAFPTTPVSPSLSLSLSPLFLPRPVWLQTHASACNQQTKQACTSAQESGYAPRQTFFLTRS